MSNKNAKSNKQSFVDKFTEWSMKWVPDSMVFVLSLTIIIYFLALGITDRGPIQLIDDYAQGFWVLLTFAMQLSLLMLTGFIVVESTFVKSHLIRLISIPKTITSTLIMYCVCVAIFSWLHWGMGYMLAMLLGREIAIRKKGLGLDYALLAAAGYCTFLVAANGPAQSAPLIAATPGNFLEQTIGHLVPLTDTALSPFLLTVVALQLISLIIFFIVIHPKKGKAIEIDEDTWKELSSPAVVEETTEQLKQLRPAERWERSRIFPMLIAFAILFWVVKAIWVGGVARVDINLLNLLFFGLALLLQQTPKNFVSAVQKGIGTTYGVIIQFPLYAGIFGIISYSGLSHSITDAFLYVSTPETYSWIVMVYTVFMDFFIPSGGSKFAVEAPFIIPAGQQLGVPVEHVINAYSTGSQMANFIQPFWALAFLATFKLRFQKILPYTFIAFILVFAIASAAFLIKPY
ncbi:TIGR00366 family protein [Acinetobacter sp. CE-15]|uniref:TIGR00366 family protein n=1 Tax=Acinetobacter sp. CE-15 TaxID=3425693 RepID=UPI003DA220F9